MLEYLKSLVTQDTNKARINNTINNITIVININNLDKDSEALQDLITFIRETAEKENTHINVDIKAR